MVAHNHHPILIGGRITTPPCFESADRRKARFFQVYPYMFIPVSYQSCVPSDMESGKICPSETRNEFIMKSTLLYQKHGKQASKNRLVSVLFSPCVREYHRFHKMGFKRPWVRLNVLTAANPRYFLKNSHIRAQGRTHRKQDPPNARTKPLHRGDLLFGSVRRLQVAHSFICFFCALIRQSKAELPGLQTTPRPTR